MRGKETAYEGNAIVGRITPAYAGKSQIFFLGRFCYGDHPRLCGEKRTCCFVLCPVCRITPAYAGKRSAMESPVYPSRDHPRLCGEKSLQKRSVMWRAGSPPPMRGKGKRIHGINTECGITPAYAGKRFSHLAFFLQSWDHPRLCGEKPPVGVPDNRITGSPPPMRGKGQHSTLV